VNWLHFDGEDHLYALFFQGPPLQENAFLRLFAKYFFCQTLNALHFEDQCDQRLLNLVWDLSVLIICMCALQLRFANSFGM
jgi:hypothetical protein